MSDHNDFEPSWGYVWGVRLLVAFAILALITVWLVGYYWSGITDRATFITVNSLTILAFVITIISLFTNRETARIMRHQELEARLQRKAAESSTKLTERIVKEMQSQREQADTQIAQTHLQLTSARDQTIQMIGQGDVMKDQLENMEAGLKETRNLLAQNERIIDTGMRQAQAAEDALKLTADAFYLSERAYLSLKGMSLEIPTLEVGKGVPLRFRIANGGRTPAFKVMTYIQGCMFKPHATRSEINEIFENAHLASSMVSQFILPGGSPKVLVGGSNALDTEGVQAWQNDQAKYCIVLKIEFDDIKVKGRWIMHHLRLTKKDGLVSQGYTSSDHDEAEESSKPN